MQKGIFTINHTYSVQIYILLMWVSGKYHYLVKVILSRRWRFLSTSVKVFLNSTPDRDLIFWKSRKSSLLCRGCSHKVKFALANGKIAYSYLLI